MHFHHVATYPSAGARKGLSSGPRVRLPLKENEWSRHQCLFEENVGKTKMEKVEGLHILKIRILELFTHEEAISTPHVRHKGRQPLIECASHDFNIMYFPLFMLLYVFFLFMLFYVFLAFYVFYFFVPFNVFYLFGGSTRAGLSLLCILNCDEELKPT